MSLFGYILVAGIVLALAAWIGFRYEADKFDPKVVKGMRVLITGASSGIGEELAYQYAKLGASLVVTARRSELLHKVAGHCKSLGATRAEYVVADMSQPSDRQYLVQETLKILGGFDQLILNHANIKPGQFFGTPEDVELLRNTMEVNFMSYADLASRFLPTLSESKGSIGVISALGGKIAAAILASYSATKFALHGFFGPLRQELRLRNAGVSVTLVVLGAVDTEMASQYLNQTFPGAEEQKLLTRSPASVIDVAQAIIRGVTNRVYEMNYPKDICWILALHKLFPEFVEDYASTALFSAMTSNGRGNPIDQKA